MAAALWKSRPSALSRYIRQFQKPSKGKIASILFAIYLIQQLRRLLGLRAISYDEKSTMPRVSIPGFTALTDQIFVREPNAVTDEAVLPESADDHPDVVMIFGWGDCLPKQVVKYAEGYEVLFPRAKQILVLAPISKAMFSELQQRSDSMLPAIRSIFPEDPEKQPKTAPKVLTHAMSNTGAVNYAAMLNVYQQIYNAPFPHDLLVFDSTPGGVKFNQSNVERWSRAMTIGTAGWFPWPFAVTQGIWIMSLCVNQVIALIRGSEHAGAWSRRASNNEQWETKAARRLYMYSKEDDLVGWEDIEEHVAEGRQLGWKSDVEVFVGSGHVVHMRQHGEQYWRAVKESWGRAVSANGAQ